MEKLVRSVLAKTKQSPYKENSVNKFLKRIFKVIEPVILDRRFWLIIRESRKTIKPKLFCDRKVQPAVEFQPLDKNFPEFPEIEFLEPEFSRNGVEILSAKVIETLPENQDENRSNGSSSFFAEALIPPQPKRKPTLLLPMNMVKKDSFSNGLTPSGLSVNHNTFSESVKAVEEATHLRRAEPLFPSEVLGDSYQYGGLQLEKNVSILQIMVFLLKAKVNKN